ncbi:MAG: caspase family protein [Planctomycetota bacterium]
MNTTHVKNMDICAIHPTSWGLFPPRIRPICAGLLLVTFLFQTGPAAEPSANPLLVLDSGGHTAIVATVDFTPDGKQLVSVSHDKTIRIWDVATGDPLWVLRPPIGPGAQGTLYAGAISPDGQLLAAAGLVVPSGNQSQIYLISLASRQVERVLVGHTSAIFALAFSPDGRRLASAGGTDRTVRIWDVTSGESQRVLRGHRDIIAAVAFSPDGQSLATACRDGTARIWSAATGQTKAVLPGHRDDVGSVAWSPDGRTVATGSDDCSIRLWAPDGTYQASLPDRGGKVGSLVFSADSRRLLYTVSSEPERCGGYLLDLESKRQLASFTGYDTSAYDAALSPDGSLAATTGGSTHEISVWKTADGSLVHRLAGGGRAVVSCGWSDDAKTIAWGNTLKPAGYNNYGPLEKAFGWTDLELTRLPEGAFRQAQPAREWGELERTGDYSIVFRRPSGVRVPLSLDERERVLCSTLLPDERAAVGSSYGLFLFDTGSGKKIGEFQGHAGYLTAVAPSPDDRYLLSASFDQTLRIWDPRRRAPLLSLFFVGTDWVAWTPEGYYAASPGGERLMGWQINQGWEQMAAFHPAVRFRKSLYRPDVIRLLFQTGNTEEALAAANRESGRTGGPTSVGEVLPPAVTITTPSAPRVEVGQPTIEIQAVATPRGEEPILAMRLLIDGRPYLGRQGQRNIVREKIEVEPVRETWTIDTTPGVHLIAVKAETAKSYAVSQPVEVTFQADKIEPPTLYVLAVGLSEYNDARQTLQFGAKDAETLAAVFQKTSPPVFRDVQVQVLSNGKATRRGILKGLDWLSEQMTPRDVAVFAFSGHGVKDAQGAFFLFPFDGEPEEVAISGVSEEEVKRHCQLIPGRLLLLLDACHAGAIGGSFRAGDVALADDLVRDLLTEDYGVIVMCSSMGREVSLENANWGHGAFSLALCEGLQGSADYNKDGTIHLNELDLYVADRVDNLTAGKQHPVTQKPTTIRSFPLARP